MGLVLACAFEVVLQDFGIDQKILSITCNNASNNNTMVMELDNSLTEFSTAHRTHPEPDCEVVTEAI